MKEAFGGKTFAANTFACGTWIGVGAAATPGPFRAATADTFVAGIAAGQAFFAGAAAYDTLVAGAATAESRS